MVKAVACPKLKPSEQGSVSVPIEVPSMFSFNFYYCNHYISRVTSAAPGQYEAYWHFHHKGRRFGHWLACQITVDPYPVKNEKIKQCSFAPSLSPSLPPYEYQDTLENARFCSDAFKREAPESPKPLNTEEVTKDLKDLTLDAAEDNDLSREEEKARADDTNCSSDSDNQSIISIADTNTSICSGSSDEFVVVPVAAKEEHEKSEETIEVEKIKEQAVENDANNNNSNEEDAAKKLADTVKKEGSKSGKVK